VLVTTPEKLDFIVWSALEEDPRGLDLVARIGLVVFDESQLIALGTRGIRYERRLPPHPEVLGALEQLRSRGFPLATLTNSSEAVARGQLDQAGLAGFFDHTLSVETVRRYKPAPEPYLMAAERLGTGPSKVRMVAAHDWDVSGAMRAGCAAAFVSRGGRHFAFGEPPDVVGADLTAVAEAILRKDEPVPIGPG
jgi:HAD superfamily hydrolase (TIGR01509 family)